MTKKPLNEVLKAGLTRGKGCCEKACLVLVSNILYPACGRVAVQRE